LIDGSIHQVSPDVLEILVTLAPTGNNKIRFPSWLRNHQKVMYLHEGLYVKGVIEWCLNNHSWRFSQRRKNGSEIFGVTLPQFCQDFQKYIDDGTIIPGWHSGKTFTVAGSTRHVSAGNLISIVPPGSAVKALHNSNPDSWFESYKEEHDGLVANETFDIISEEEYHRLCRLHGVRAIPSMCTFVVKHNNGIPTRAKSHIVVLRNLEQCTWTKADCFSPVISIPMICFLTALAVHKGRTLKQADCKFAFIQASLPSDEHTIIRPPIRCPFSRSRQFWRLRKSLYGLRRAPRHWYNKLRLVLESTEIGLQSCPHDPCLFHGTLLPGKPPIFVAIYVDDILYFSEDDTVEQYYRTALSQKVQVEFLGDAAWYIGIKFDWHKFPDGTISCHLSQEGYAAANVEEMGLMSANKCPLMTPFRSGLPIDAIPHVGMTPEERAPLITKMQCWMGMINWLQQCTRPDLATIFSLLATRMHCPSPGHLEAAKYVGRHILSTLDLGLLFSTRATSTLETFIHFPISDNTNTTNTSDNSLSSPITTFCDANWGPQDASHPSSSNLRPVSIHESKSICGHIFFYGGCPILWKTHKEKRISRSSCEAKATATDECVKNIQMFRHILEDLNMAPSAPTLIYNDNRGAVEWSHSFSTKGMRHLNIRENAIREAQQLAEVSIAHIPGTCKPTDIFTKEFKSDCTFRSLRNLLLYPSSSFPCSSLAWGVLGHLEI
jgi:hypothetical protein